MPNIGNENAIERPLAPPGKLRGYEFFRSLNSPKTVLAPMVDHSEYAWRLLSKRYNTDLVYTPMMHSKHFVEQPKTYPARNYSTGPGDRPLVVQFCGNDPYYVVRAALKVQDTCDAVDLNLGCPQGIAKRGHYGAFLMEELDLICRIVRDLDSALSIPVTCKIRCFEDIDSTIEYAKRLENAGCSILTVHGRTRDMKGANTGFANWDWIKRIKEAVTIPVIANGNILYKEDVEECLKYTGCDSVMSAEANLYNPAVFSGEFPFTVDISREYLDIVKQNGNSSRPALIKAHLFKIFHRVLDDYPLIRNKIPKTWDLAGFEAILDELQVVLDHERRQYELENGPFEPEKCAVDPDTKLKVIPRFYCQPYVRSSMAPRSVTFTDEDREKILERRKRKNEGHQQKPNAPKKVLLVCSCKKVCSSSCVSLLCRDCCKKKLAEDYPPTPTGPPRPDAQLQCDWNAVYQKLVSEHFKPHALQHKVSIFLLPKHILDSAKVTIHNYAELLVPALSSPMTFETLSEAETYLGSHRHIYGIILVNVHIPQQDDDATYGDLVFPSSSHASGLFAVEVIDAKYRARKLLCTAHKFYRHEWILFKNFREILDFV